MASPAPATADIKATIATDAAIAAMIAKPRQTRSQSKTNPTSSTDVEESDGGKELRNVVKKTVKQKSQPRKFHETADFSAFVPDPSPRSGDTYNAYDAIWQGPPAGHLENRSNGARMSPWSPIKDIPSTPKFEPPQSGPTERGTRSSNKLDKEQQSHIDKLDRILEDQFLLMKISKLTKQVNTEMKAKMFECKITKLEPIDAQLAQKPVTEHEITQLCIRRSLQRPAEKDAREKLAAKWEKKSLAISSIDGGNRSDRINSDDNTNLLANSSLLETRESRTIEDWCYNLLYKLLSINMAEDAARSHTQQYHAESLDRRLLDQVNPSHWFAMKKYVESWVKKANIPKFEDGLDRLRYLRSSVLDKEAPKNDDTYDQVQKSIAFLEDANEHSSSMACPLYCLKEAIHDRKAWQKGFSEATLKRLDMAVTALENIYKDHSAQMKAANSLKDILIDQHALHRAKFSDADFADCANDIRGMIDTPRSKEWIFTNYSPTIVEALKELEEIVGSSKMLKNDELPVVENEESAAAQVLDDSLEVSDSIRMEFRPNNTCTVAPFASTFANVCSAFKIPVSTSTLETILVGQIPNTVGNQEKIINFLIKAKTFRSLVQFSINEAAWSPLATYVKLIDSSPEGKNSLESLLSIFKIETPMICRDNIGVLAYLPSTVGIKEQLRDLRERYSIFDTNHLDDLEVAINGEILPYKSENNFQSKRDVRSASASASASIVDSEVKVVKNQEKALEVEEVISTRDSDIELSENTEDIEKKAAAEVSKKEKSETSMTRSGSQGYRRRRSPSPDRRRFSRARRSRSPDRWSHRSPQYRQRETNSYLRNYNGGRTRDDPRRQSYGKNHIANPNGEKTGGVPRKVVQYEDDFSIPAPPTF